MPDHPHPAPPAFLRPAPAGQPRAAIWRGRGPAPAPPRGAVAAIGNFDGVHLGHKALIARAAAEAAARGRPVGVVTFEPHPNRFFRPDSPHFQLTPPDMRAALLCGQGVAGIAELPFDAALAGLEPGEFVERILVDALDLAAVVVGEDFAFGRRRAGRFADLAALMRGRGREAFAVAPVADAQGAVISSSRVRAALADGDVALANALLGHRWSVRAPVAHGDKRGRELGFPTANMLLAPDCGLRNGIYAVRARIGGVWRPGAASFGRRPTFDDGAPRLETFVFDWSGDLYGQVIEVEFVAWIRPELRFDTVEALMRQMTADCLQARGQIAAEIADSE